MNYIPKYLLNEIREKVEVLRDPSSPHFAFKPHIFDFCRMQCKKREERAIEKNAQIHSFKMEHPNLNVPHNVPRNKREIKKGAKQIKEAYEWGKRNFDRESFNEEFIRQIAGRIAPHLYHSDIATYRKGGVTIAGASVTPPYPEKLLMEIPVFVEELREQLKCPELANRIESAIYAHLHLVRIHPFNDGNGRTARTLQDLILNDYGLPLPVIEAGERETYYNVLDRAVYDWKHKKYSGEVTHGATEGEREFYSFIAGKINVSLDKLIECIS